MPGNANSKQDVSKPFIVQVVDSAVLCSGEHIQSGIGGVHVPLIHVMCISVAARDERR